MTVTTSPTGEWIVRGIESAAARQFLERFQPWRMELQFADGPKASNFQIRQPFNEFPLRKLQVAFKHIPAEQIRGGRVLDVGFNMGYNSIYLASELGCRVTGIDVEQQHKAVADEIAKMVRIDADFRIQSAEEYESPNEFDLVLHFGTLYHLPNPLRSIEKCIKSLKPGGWFALETTCYRGSDDKSLSKWVYGFNGDVSNYWALGEGAIEQMAEICGLVDFKMVFESWPPVLKREMSRALWVGRKAS